MARIPYTSDEAAGPADLVEKIRSRRGGKLLNLDRMLLNSPALARGWNAYLGMIREELTVPPRLRELVTCAIAVLNRASYELDQHLPLFVQAGGNETQAEALRKFPDVPSALAVFDAGEQAALQLTLEMTSRIEVSDTTFERVRRAFQNDQYIVELIAIIAAYNMVSRFLVALNVEEPHV